MSASVEESTNVINLYAKRLLGAAWALLLIIPIVFAVDSFIGRPGVDASLYIYATKGILEGDIPYLDRWFNKGPALLPIDLAGLVIHDTWGIWVVQALFLLGATGIALLTFRRLFGFVPALFASALFLIFFPRFAAPGNFTEQYALLFQFLALYLFVRSQDIPDADARSIRFSLFHLAIGALGAASFLLRANLIVVWLVIGVYWLCVRGPSLRKLAWSVAGGAGVLLAVAGAFFAIGALGALWDAAFAFNFAYSDATLQERLGVVRDLTTRMDPVFLLVVAAWCIALVSLARGNVIDAHIRIPVTLALFMLPLEVLGLSLSGYSGLGFLHYYLTALPVSTLLLAFLVWIVIERRLVAPMFLSIVLLLGAADFSLSLYRFERLGEKYLSDGVFVEDKISRIADFIQAETDPGDPILVWGYDPRIYLAADRNAPTRFFHQNALIKATFVRQDLRDQFFSDVAESMPRLIIDLRQPRYPPLARAERAQWRPVDRFIRDPSPFVPFFDFVEAHYALAGTIDGAVIYERRPDPLVIKPAEFGELIILSDFDVYLNGRILTFVKDPCTQSDIAGRFILHVLPVDRSSIGGNELQNLDFTFITPDEWSEGDTCVVSIELPEYPIASIRTGQYNAARSGHEWLEEYRFHQSE